MASYTSDVNALEDVTSGQTLAEAGGVGHAEVENRQNTAVESVASFLDTVPWGVAVGDATTPITVKATIRPTSAGSVIWFTDFSLAGGGVPDDMQPQDLQVRVDEAT